MCAPLYISETAPTAIRGRMLTVQQLMITIGIFIAAAVNSIIIVTFGKSDINLEWRLAMGMQCIPAVLLLVVMFFMPQSPRWLATKDRNAEALDIIARLRSEPANSPGAVAEYKTITDAVEFERTIGNGSWSELMVPGLRNRLFIAMTIQMLQQWTGINVILYYQGALLEGMGISKENAAIPFTLANDFINFIATFPGMYLIERAGRRKLLLVGGFGMGIAHFLVCTFIGLSRSTNHPSLSWGAIFSVYLFFFFFASTWGPVAWVYQSEIFPLRVRAKGIFCTNYRNWCSNHVKLGMERDPCPCHSLHLQILGLLHVHHFWHGFTVLISRLASSCPHSCTSLFRKLWVNLWSKWMRSSGYLKLIRTLRLRNTRIRNGWCWVSQ